MGCWTISLQSGQRVIWSCIGRLFSIVLNCSIVRRILTLTMSRVAFLLPGVIYFPIVLITLIREEWVNAHSFALLRPCAEREVPHAQIYIGQQCRADKWVA